MTSAEIRNSFLDFFKEKQHTTVPSASILPQSPGLLFTNAGMNQFVPYFLGTEKAPYDPPRAADTQKCIRAGGKHNDLEDVGYDTYHHTFFEMLGNWSFGNYFKEEAIAWAWELVVERWGLPANRLYATVYAPSEGDPSEFDHEAYQLWKGFFEKAGLDPKIHIVNGNVEDNFWKMGDTGPCGPCSELHVDMTPNGDTGGKLVNMDSDLCIEIWNLVFIQYNAEEDGTYRDLPSKHVDTGMGFERVCSLIQNTKNFTDFSKKPTNYATDVFQPIFRMLEKLSGKKYVDVYPGEESDALEQAIAFRVIADHIRTLSFSIADSIIPGNTGRNYVLRRILRRAVKYGRTLGFNGNEPFLPRLVDTLVEEFSHVFPEIKTRAAVIKETLTLEEESFNKTLDRGMEKFEKAAGENVFPPEDAFQLYDTFGFPLDLTALLCRERGITLDEKAVEARMEEARKLSRASQKKMVVRATEISTDVITEFLGFEKNSCEAIVLEIHGNLVITDKTVFFTEMGGQEGDTGTLNDSTITSTQQIGSAIAHQIEGNIPAVGDTVDLTINRERRSPIEAHHTATHLLHWAIHKVISPDASQQGSSVSPDRLTFDFNSKAVTPEQIEAIEERVNSAIKADDTVSWVEVPHSTVKDREDIMQFFGDKYGDLVRVVQIGGGDKTLDGYSMELCGGTHVRKTSDIGIFKIKSEGSTGAGIRRIEAVCGPAAEAFLGEQQEKESAEKSEALAKLAKANESLAKLDAPTLLVPDNALAFEVKNQAIEAEKALKKAQATGAARMADSLIAEKNITGNIVISTEGSPALLQELLNGLKKIQFTQAAFIVIDDGSKLHLGAICGNEGKENGHGAGNLIQNLGPIAGGKGGGKPDMARGAASEREKLDPLVAAANQELGLQTRPEPKSKNTP
ncbi:MAG: alanine--tRNA ligase [Verrucomicrobia bacterium]|jgi:alanyl-tRNA synthetase|nr:alanine--tRNA ligase [Verrucomicrobiota bacterium]MDA7530029.1 alanine--tRNA ligase [bacterium]MDB4646622.1 alanine--tRNA ligase [Akkermansiaceae bacterium]MDC0567993.1 alanine--tRNA ligase [Akkermansiaceae bacterium]